MSQPAFSMRIRNLEERLGTALVKRGNRFQGLTAEGEAILQHARKILDDVRALEQDVRAVKGEVTGCLTLGAIPTTIAYAAQLAIRLRDSNPGLTLRIVSDTSLGIQQGVDDSTYDAGLTYSEGVSTDLLKLEALYQERYVLLAPRTLAPRDSGVATWAEAAKVPLCLLEPHMQNRRILDQVFADCGLQPSVISETNGFTAAMVMAVHGMAATIVPEVYLEAVVLDGGVVALPLEQPIVEKSVGLITPGRNPNIPVLQALRRAADLS
ncbi:DNA-binding transcriptional regulator, LysR family [Poseidonocella sedimentorum]|uniref:DNA-binding transcriptional regulator, LysR family n=2 Tax=Poseidonocella sedimentorum TaxID=871652 RepID=A0A1I6CSE2_9RHOB|nr:DNA-binding transcriptional regulator, LysR family [Poseidonocella sedimentorum]